MPTILMDHNRIVLFLFPNVLDSASFDMAIVTRWVRFDAHQRLIISLLKRSIRCISHLGIHLRHFCDKINSMATRRRGHTGRNAHFQSLFCLEFFSWILCFFLFGLRFASFRWNDRHPTANKTKSILRIETIEFGRKGNGDSWMREKGLTTHALVTNRKFYPQNRTKAPVNHMSNPYSIPVGE